MIPNPPQQAVKLQPPGAGLPKLERFVGGLLIRRALRRYEAERTDAALCREAELVLQLARSCDEAARRRPVLINRIAGIEDSSRHWSVYMTLDHLRIVSDKIAAVIDCLARGKRPPKESRIEDLKPSPDADGESLEALQISVADFRHLVADLPTPYPEETHRHPWFGPLGIAGWHIMAAMHMKIHRQQLEKILAGLNQD